MNWDSVKDTISEYAPLLGGLIGGPAGSVVTLVAGALGTKPTPDAIQSALNADPDAKIKLLTCQENNRAHLEELSIKTDLVMFTQNAQNYRAELAQQDNYTKRWRPTMGYAVTFSWVITWIAVMYVLIFETDKAAEVLNSLSATAFMWSIALAVLGVSVRSRSKDKQVVAGQQPSSLLDGLKNIVSRGN